MQPPIHRSPCSTRGRGPTHPHGSGMPGRERCTSDAGGSGCRISRGFDGTGSLRCGSALRSDGPPPRHGAAMDDQRKNGVQSSRLFEQEWETDKEFDNLVSTLRPRRLIPVERRGEKVRRSRRPLKTSSGVPSFKPSRQDRIGVANKVRDGPNLPRLRKVDSRMKFASDGIIEQRPHRTLVEMNPQSRDSGCEGGEGHGECEVQREKTRDELVTNRCIAIENDFFWLQRLSHCCFINATIQLPENSVNVTISHRGCGRRSRGGPR